MSVEDREPERYYDWMLWKMRQEDHDIKDPLPIIDSEIVKSLRRIEHKIDLLLTKDQKTK